MRSWLTTAILLIAATPVVAETFVYVSMGPEQKIQIYKLDDGSGDLTAVEATPVGGEPGALGVDPAGKLLFVSVRSKDAIASYRVDPVTGKITLLSTATLARNGRSSYLATDRTGRWLLSASYNGGNATVHRLNDDGTIQSPAVQTVATAFTSHCIATDRDNRWVFVPTVLSNEIFQFRFDAAAGTLEPAGRAQGGAPKSGPRHLAFHPRLDMAFVSDETGSSITAYAFDPKTGLKPTQTVSSLPAGFAKANVPADVKIHPSGKFAWITNRGHDSLAGFAIDSATGRLTALEQTPTEKNPRSIDIDASGRYLFSGGEDSGKLAVFRVDAETGKLTRLRTYDVGKSVGWVLAVKTDGVVGAKTEKQK